MLVSGLSVVLSNLVSNVPAVLLFKPLMAVIPDKEQAWLALAMSSTLATNASPLKASPIIAGRRMASQRGARSSAMPITP